MTESVTPTGHLLKHAGGAGDHTDAGAGGVRFPVHRHGLLGLHPLALRSG
jgi:hypothetical protein